MDIRNLHSMRIGFYKSVLKICNLKIFMKLVENILHYAMFWHIVGVALFRITKCKNKNYG